MQRRKDSIRFIALFMTFVLLLSSASFGALGREILNWNRRNIRNIASSSNSKLRTATDSSVNPIGTDNNLGTASNILYDLRVSLTDEEKNDLEPPVDPMIKFILQFDFKLHKDAKEGDIAYISLPSETLFDFDDDWELYIHAGECGHNQFSNKEGIDFESPEYENCDIVFMVTYEKVNNGHRFRIECLEDIKEYEELDAYFWVLGWFNEEEIIPGEDQTTILVFGEGEYEIEIKFEYKPEDPVDVKISKSRDGNPVFDSDLNKYIINWKVTLDSGEDELDSLEVYDVLPANTSYISESTKIGYDGGASTRHNGNENGWSTRYATESNTLYWTFQSVQEYEEEETDLREIIEPISGKFTIYFSTVVDSMDNMKPTSGNKYKFTNNAYVVVGDETKRSQASADVDLLILKKDNDRVGEISKDDRDVKWTITINPEKWTVTNPSLTLVDELQKHLTLDTATANIRLYRQGNESDSFSWIDIVNAGGMYKQVEDVPDEVLSYIEKPKDETGSIMIIPLGKLLADRQPNGLRDTWILEYVTSVEDAFFETHQTATLWNYAYLLVTETSGILPYPLPGVNKNADAKSDLIQKRLVQADIQAEIQEGGLDIRGPIAEWEILVNGNRNDYSGKVVLIDDILDTTTGFSGMQFLSETLIVEKEIDAVDDEWEPIEYELAESSLNQHDWSILFPDGIGEFVVRITFKTIVTDITDLATYKGDSVSIAKYKNTATLYVDDDEKGSGEDTVEFDRYILSKSNDYDYAAREIKWEIHANTNGLFLPGETNITDILPYGLEVVGGINGISIKDENNSLISPNEKNIVTVINETGEEVQKFKITFEDLEVPVIITFNTKFTSEFEQSSIFSEADSINFTNNVKLENEDLGIDVDAKSSCIIENILVKKTGTVEAGDSIRWKVEINPRGWHAWQPEYLDGLVIMDGEMDENLVLATDTVRLYYATISAEDGSLIKGEQSIAISGKNVEYVKSQGEHYFKFTFPDSQLSSTKAYILEFVTDALRGGSFSNKIEMTGTINGDSETIVSGVSISSSGGGASGNKRGALLEIKKVDSETGALLTGAVFELENYLGYTDEAETDSDGIARFANLQQKLTYKLREISAPLGYNIDYSKTDGYSDEEKAIIISVDSSATIELEVENTRIIGNVEIKKVGEKNTLLDGAVFRLESIDEPDFVYESEPTQEGKVIIKNVRYGTYRVIEITAPAGYEIAEISDTFEFHFEKDDETILLPYNIKNNKIKGEVEFTKVNQDNIPLEKAIFTLTRDLEWDEENKIQNTEFEKSYRTESDENGQVIFKNVDYGRYTIEEVSAPFGYERVKVEIGTVIVNSDGEAKIEFEEKFTDGLIVNEKLKGSVELYKASTKEEGSRPLRGAVFELQRVNEEEPNYNTFEEKYTFTTNKNGVANLKNVDYGKYKVVEVTPPKGYVKGSGTISPEEIIISGDNKEVKIIATNEKIKGSVEIYKKDSTGNPLSDAEFELRRINKVLPDGFSSKYNPGILGPTNEEGYATLENVEYGKYDVYEITSPDGYQKIETKIDTIEIKTNGEMVSINQGKAVENKKITGTLEIEKVSEAGIDGTHHLLDGAKFQLIRDNTDLPQHFKEDLTYEATTKDGIAVINDIEYGTYQIYEIQAPKGYTIGEEDTKYHIGEVTISEQGKTIKLTHTDGDYSLLANKRYTADITITKKGEIDRDGNPALLAGAEFRLERIVDDLDNGFQTTYNLTTGTNGKASLSGVEFGSYKIYETKAPTGYKSVKDEFTDENGDPIIIRVATGSNAILSVELYNEIIREDLLVIKTNTSKTTRLRGAKFQLYQVADIFGPLDEEVLLYDNLITNDDGEISVENLPYGEYYLKETQAPSGYRLPSNTKTYFEIKEEGKTIELTITNARRNTGGGGGSTPTTEAPQPSQPTSEEPTTPEETEDPSATLPTTTAPRGGGSGDPGTILPPGYTFEYDEETGQFMIIDPNGIPLGWFDSIEDVLGVIPKTGDGAPVVIFAILLAGAGITIIVLVNKKKYFKNKR